MVHAHRPGTFSLYSHHIKRLCALFPFTCHFTFLVKHIANQLIIYSLKCHTKRIYLSNKYLIFHLCQKEKLNNQICSKMCKMCGWNGWIVCYNGGKLEIQIKLGMQILVDLLPLALLSLQNWHGEVVVFFRIIWRTFSLSLSLSSIVSIHLQF